MAQSPSHKLGQMIEIKWRRRSNRAWKRWPKNLACIQTTKAGAQHAVAKLRFHGRIYTETRMTSIMCWRPMAHPSLFGKPKAFIETACAATPNILRTKPKKSRRHCPVSGSFADRKPFLGVVLAGEFTNPSLDQLRSHGFAVAYCPYSSIVQAFDKVGVDVSSEEDSSGQELTGRSRH